LRKRTATRKRVAGKFQGLPGECHDVARESANFTIRSDARRCCPRKRHGLGAKTKPLGACSIAPAALLSETSDGCCLSQSMWPSGFLCALGFLSVPPAGTSAKLPIGLALTPSPSGLFLRHRRYRKHSATAQPIQNSVVRREPLNSVAYNCDLCPEAHS